MLEQAIGSGFRNSGIMMGKSQLTLAIRSTQNMETPISCDGKLIVDNKVSTFYTGPFSWY